MELNLKAMDRKCVLVSDLLKTMAHPKRLMILCHLSQGRMCVSEVEEVTQISQSQVSQFLKRMQLEGLVDSEKEGNFVYYFIKDDNVKKLLKSMNEIFCS